MEFTLLGLYKQRVLQQALEDGLDMIYMFLLATGEDQDVVQVDKHTLVEHVS